jgi:hypothetical protein
VKKLLLIRKQINNLTLAIDFCVNSNKILLLFINLKIQPMFNSNSLEGMPSNTEKLEDEKIISSKKAIDKVMETLTNKFNENV